MTASTHGMFPEHLPSAAAMAEDRELGGVVIAHGKLIGFVCWHVSDDLAKWENREAYKRACDRAIAKLRAAGVRGKRGSNIQ